MLVCSGQRDARETMGLLEALPAAVSVQILMHIGLA